MEILQQRHNVRNDWGMLLGDNCGPQTHNSNCTETRCVASIGRKDHLISSCNTSSLATEHVCSFPIPFPVALRNLREKKLARKLVSKPSLVRCGVVPPPQKPSPVRCPVGPPPKKPSPVRCGVDPPQKKPRPVR